MREIQHIVFDLGGVILPIEFSRTITALKQAGIRNADNLFGLGHADSFFKAYEEGLISDEAFLHRLQQEAGGQSSVESLEQAWNALLLEFPPERIELLSRLRSRYRLYLFSNTNGIHLKAFQQKFKRDFGQSFDDLFEKSWYSHLIKKRKPDLSAFQWILEDGSLEPGATLFIDDALNNVEGARAAGMQAIHINPDLRIADIDWQL